MSARRPEDDDVEIDVGRYARRLFSRWWIVAACILVAILVAFLTRTGSRQTWTAKALIYLGQPFAPNGTSALPTTTSNNPYTPTVLVKQEAVIDAAARAAGLPPDELRGRVSTQIASNANSPKSSYTPYVYITVRGPWEDKAARAANALAQQILAFTNRYPKSRLKIVEQQIQSEKAEYATLRRREKNFERQLAVISRLPAASSSEQLIKLSAQSTIISALNGITIRIGTLADELAQNQQIHTLSVNVEQNQLVTPARSVRTTAGSKSANYGIAVLLGLLVGVVLALLSFAFWPTGRPLRAVRAAGD